MAKSFDEWMVDAESWSERDAYEAGQQSKQAEIDELQLKLSEDSRVLHNVIDIERKKCEELQARIDGALKELELLNCYRTGNSDNAINILKGNKDENY